MPGHERLSLDAVVERAHELEEAGVRGVIVFGIPDRKDADGSRAWADDGIVQRAVRHLDERTDLTIITDVCLCEYTEHGHCGVLAHDARKATGSMTVENDATLAALARTAGSHADAGADIVAPSAMMDGQVGAIRTALDDAGHEDIAILSYAVKYESAYYGPFREAADGAPAFGDRRHYQMDPHNRREARREVELDIDEGADMVMVKPAMTYLDIVRDIRETVSVPVAAYHVSGEYAMLVAADERGWLDREATAMEAAVSMKRAGADLIITYFAKELAQRLSGRSR